MFHIYYSTLPSYQLHKIGTITNPHFMDDRANAQTWKQAVKGRVQGESPVSTTPKLMLLTPIQTIIFLNRWYSDPHCSDRGMSLKIPFQHEIEVTHPKSQISASRWPPVNKALY